MVQHFGHEDVLVLLFFYFFYIKSLPITVQKLLECYGHCDDDDSKAGGPPEEVNKEPADTHQSHKFISRPKD